MKEQDRLVKTLLLREVIKDEPLERAPTKSSYAGDWVEFIIEIDADHTAQIRMPLEDYYVLMELGE